MPHITGPWDSFKAYLPQHPTTPVVVSVPHAGTSTQGFEDALAPTLDVRCDADLWVDELYEGSPAGAFLTANLSRFVCDLNRHPDDVSTHAVPEHPSPRNSHGRGFVWEITTEGTAALARPLRLDEWKQRQEIHAAYYGALATAIERARSKFGFAVLVDGHSMPSRGKAMHTDTGNDRAAIVPGDRQGQSCAPALSRLVQDHFLQHGYGVKFNDPYQGGFITTHHGHPANAVHAIQIEMRRDLYMNETTFAKLASGFDRLRFTLEALLRSLDQFDPHS